MNNEIKINKANKSITFINNGIAYSQFGIANEILDLITNLRQENKSLTEQLEYLRSGEYLNQVKWERDLNENLNQTMSIELINYKSRCEKINEILKESPDFNYSNDYIILKRRIESVLQNGSDDNE